MIGEGEATLAEIVDKLMSKKKKLLNYSELVKIDGIAFDKTKYLENSNSLKVSNF